MSEKNIYQRMSAITAELRTVAKNLNVETGKGKGYKAVGEVDVLNAVKPLEEKHGVYSYPCAREILESAMLESESTYNDKTTKKTTFFERIKTVYRFVNVDKPEEYIETTTFSEGIDTQDKGSGKAMTYGDKYALMKGYKISTGDDPDQNASEEIHYSKQNKAPNVICTDCGIVIKDIRKRDGSTWPAEEIKTYSESRFGRCLCWDCQKAAMKAEDGKK